LNLEVGGRGEQGEWDCVVCGKLAWLDDLGACSAECDDRAERRSLAEGHNHVPGDAPHEYSGSPPCPVCGW